MHHTKVKADIAVAKTIADLSCKGYVSCIPLSEHQPFDLVAVGRKGKVLKLQIKYAALKNNGTVDVKFRTSWADKHGTHTRRYAENDFDYYAIYCHEKDVVLYVPNKNNCPKSLRFEKTVNNQSKLINWANNYLKI